MFVNSIKKVSEVMFPIFRFNKINQSQTNISVAGTGFFINSEGYFLSVAHLFDCENNTSFRYWGELPDNLHNPNLLVQEIAKDDELDLFLGKININNNKFLPIASGLPNVGKSLCISGYPLAKISSNITGGIELGGVRRYFQPSFMLDYAILPVDIGKDKIRKHKGFLVRDFGLFGMSGGPVFDIKGVVYGIQGSVTPPRESRNGSRTITVENAVVIGSDVISKFLNDNKILL